MIKSFSPATILIVDDDEAIRKSFSFFFEDCGYLILEACNGREGLDSFQRNHPDLVFTDLLMPEMSGLEFLAALKTLSPETPVIVISGIGVVEDAIKAVKLGAWDFITKPVHSLTELEIVAKRALETIALRHEVSSLREQILTGQLANPEAFAKIITQDDGMLRIFHYIEAIAPTSQPVLITGQTGTGKELIAHALHDVSGRSGNFVAINVGGLDDLMFSDTLFGHVRGAFTGADQQRDGIIAQASGGTLFLDEIGDLSDASQIKLLRLLQEQEYFRLGSDTPQRTTARIIAATNRDLRSMADKGIFRQDLYYRLCTHQVHLPALASRKGDLPALLKHFTMEAAASMGKESPACSAELCHYLGTYEFPGNIRELKAMTYDAVAQHTKGMLSKSCFLQAMAAHRPATASLTPDSGISELAADKDGRMPTLKEAEAILIRKALELADGNQGVAARYLGITRQGLNKIIHRRKILSTD